MARATQIFRKARKAFHDLNLLKILQSEITHELSSTPCQNYENNSTSSDFTVEHDSLKSQDVVLRRKLDSGEEVVISALLGPLRLGYEGAFPRDILMKICVSKPGVSSLLQFDCGVSENGHGGSPFELYNAYYLPSSDCLGPSVYRGPSFSSLDPRLQDALKEFLISRGVEERLTNFLLIHLHKKEQGQYLNWLQDVESSIAKGQSNEL
ncbi:mitochondrial acidic protein mam33 [Cucumis sativus]|uniref:mitochondrial acidic protein mam33 n=1 Tax=Cucumis sativus TaxID=3659 RepID=UPI0002B4163A|nr:mitochondrial acidic protein mam33 [Cucumis sativus]KAE8646855.1 hypothetical protein Csa_020765 [Cucumis sativus]